MKKALALLLSLCLVLSLTSITAFADNSTLPVLNLVDKPQFIYPNLKESPIIITFDTNGNEAWRDLIRDNKNGLLDVTLPK